MYLTAAQTGFSLITIIFYYLLYREFRLALPKTSLTAQQQKNFIRNFLVIFFAWLMFTYIWSRFGIFKNINFWPVNVLPVIVIPFIIVLVLTFSKAVKALLPHIPQENIIWLQSFRFYAEVLVWALYASALLPAEMTFEGRNFDVLTGVTAVLLTTRVSGFMLLNKLSKTLLVLWNIAGLALLLHMVYVTAGFMPTPFHDYLHEPSAIVLTEFPISLLAAFLIPLALMLHILSLRKISMKTT